MKQKISRRDVLKITALMGGVVAGGRFLNRTLTPAAVRVSEQRVLMGTIIHLTLIAENQDAGQAAIQAAFDHMEAQIQLFDPRQQDGPVRRLNRLGKLNQPPSELVALLRQALAYGDLTGGAFDVTVKPVVDAHRQGRQIHSEALKLVDYRQVNVRDDHISLGLPGMEITLDGIAKGRVVDAGVEILQSHGFDRVLVEAGGDLFAQGLNYQEQLWRIAIRHPRAKSGSPWLAKLDAANCAVATSGDSMNSFRSDHSLHHIIDPRMGVSPLELCSATVIAPSTTQADAFATAVMVMGLEDGLAFIENQKETACLLVTKSLSVHRSSSFPVG